MLCYNKVIYYYYYYFNFILLYYSIADIMVFTTFQYHIIISIMYSFIIIKMKFTFKAFGSLIIPITVTFTVIQKSYDFNSTRYRVLLSLILNVFNCLCY